MIDLLQAIYEFFTSGIYDFITEAYAWIIIKLMTAQYYLLKLSLEFSYDIAQSLITQLNITENVTSLITSLPVTTQNQLNFFNIIEGINMIISACITRYVMAFRS